MKWELCITMIVLACLALVACGGCEEAQQQWGKGDPPESWQNMFGNDSIARLNFVQTQTINQHQAIIYGVTLEDPNGQPVRKRGLVERITTLEGLVEQSNTVDTNSDLIKWPTGTVTFYDSADEFSCHLGFRSDGVVFWKPVDPNE